MTLNLPDTGAPVAPDGRITAASADRNADAILAVLHAKAPKYGKLLEIASGTGQYAARFSTSIPGLCWQPTDLNPDQFSSIRAWSKDCKSVLPPQQLDATAPGWSKNHSMQDAILVVNLTHLITASATQTMITEMALALAPSGILLVYGPFLRNNRPTSTGDARFDDSLRASDPQIG
jgi:hypothetical protein